MSNIYIQEPPTSGKVLLKTTVGDIDVELWTKECPKACRNFIQLCLEGYFDGLIFHRLVKDFIVQTGDPTGTGLGGESVYGQPFRDEFHSRLKFNRRGLVGMANAGKDDNSSQFFFTLAETPELQGKHTLFGKVTGNTIYNMIRLGEGTADRNERPHHPHKIISTEILNNPFDDILPREIAAKAKTKAADKKEEPPSDGKKDFKLLSFGDEAEEEQEQILKALHNTKGKSKSSHDLTSDPRLSSVPVVDSVQVLPIPDQKTQSELLEQNFRDKKDKKKKRRRKSYDGGDDSKAEDKTGVDATEGSDKSLSKAEEARQEYKKLKKEMARDQRKKLDKDAGLEKVEEKDDVVSEFLREKEKYRLQSSKILKTKDSGREEQTLALLSKFRSKLKDQQQKQGKEEDVLVAADWLGHRFTCSKEDEGPVLAKDANLRGEADWYDLCDPRNKIAQRRAGEASASSSKK